MGFDPNRKHRTTRFDYWYVGLGVVVCAGLLLWALFG